MGNRLALLIFAAAASRRPRMTFRPSCSSHQVTRGCCDTPRWHDGLPLSFPGDDGFLRAFISAEFSIDTWESPPNFPPFFPHAYLRFHPRRVVEKCRLPFIRAKNAGLPFQILQARLMAIYSSPRSMPPASFENAISARLLALISCTSFISLWRRHMAHCHYISLSIAEFTPRHAASPRLLQNAFTSSRMPR